MRNEFQIMYQARASVGDDVPSLAGSPHRGTYLFIEVRDLDAVEKALQGVSHLAPRRKPSYGAEEIIVRGQAGNAVTFVEFNRAGE